VIRFWQREWQYTRAAGTAGLRPLANGRFSLLRNDDDDDDDDVDGGGGRGARFVRLVSDTSLFCPF
jgi:hypothetical protein